jgi:hypothetical protein
MRATARALIDVKCIYEKKAKGRHDAERKGMKMKDTKRERGERGKTNRREKTLQREG